MAGLTYLDVNYSAVTSDIGALRGLVGLDFLSLEGCATVTSDVDGLARCGLHDYLSLHYTAVTGWPLCTVGGCTFDDRDHYCCAGRSDDHAPWSDDPEPCWGDCSCLVSGKGGSAIPAALVAAGGFAEKFTLGLQNGVALGAHAQCFVQLIGVAEVVDDPALHVSAGQGGQDSAANYNSSLGSRSESDFRCDVAEQGGPFGASSGGVGGEGEGEATWFRFPPGSSMACAPTGPYHCGTRYPSWLLGWPDTGLPTDDHQAEDYAVPAAARDPPPLGDPPGRAVICFHCCSDPCCHSVEVLRLSCGAFELWWLPPVLVCMSAYCLRG